MVPGGGGPFDPESKGIVERPNRFLETSFLPGRCFQDPLDFNAQLEEWLQLAKRRTVRSLGARPCDLLSPHRGHMLELPAAPPPVGFRQRVRIGRDHYARVLGNDYSIDPSAIDRFVEVHADLDRVRAHLDGSWSLIVSTQAETTW